jgi:hypothetical protein
MNNRQAFSATTVWKMAAVLVAFGEPVFAAQSQQLLSMTFAATSVVITGATRSATVYVLSLAREPRGYYTNIQPTESKVTAASDSVSVPYDHRLSWRSIWFAADLASGAYASGAPPDYSRTRRIDLTDKNLKKDLGGEISQLGMTGEVVEFIVVRPNVGVWSGLVTSRGALDDAKESGKVTVSIGNLVPRAGTTELAPKKLKKGDIVFVANSFSGEFGAAAVE